ncbi:MAG TPA: hypothetical protein VMN37_05135 [Gemmatimonadales bacterium]|nr:hypothetical protein [Gemmatimonadales bacterium]
MLGDGRVDPPAWVFGPRSAARVAAALLSVGLRGPARGVIRSLSRSSPAAPGDAESLRGLIGAFASWAGDADFLRRHADALAAAGEGGLLFRSDRTASAAGTPDALPLAARRFLADPASADPIPAAEVLEAAVLLLWGIEPDAPAGAVTLRPRPPRDWPAMVLRRLRIGSTALDVEVRRRRGDLVVRVHRAAGPPLVATVEPPGSEADGIWADDVELSGGRARLEIADRHEIIFRRAVE